MIRITDISRDITTCPVYPGDPDCTVTRVQTVGKGSDCNLSKIDTGLHNGTHIDAPLHFIADGTAVDGIPLESCIGECEVVSVPAGAIGAQTASGLPTAERLLIKGCGGAWFTGDGAKALADRGVRLIGTDANSVGIHGAQVEPHRAFLSAGVVILENLDLSQVEPGRYFLSALPVKIGGAEAAPVRAVLLSDE